MTRLRVTGHNRAVASVLADEVLSGSRSRPASIRDVARAAGVSYQTVSRVINDNPSVKPTTRAAVLQAIERLAYRPSRVARALAGGPVQSVTVLTANTRHYGFAAALEGIEEAARAAGFAMGVRVVDSVEPEHVRDAVERAIEPGGALIVIAYDRPGVAALKAVPADVPVAAMVETPASGESAGKLWVWIDDREAAFEATTYLLGLGHRTVHYLSIPPSTDRSPRMAGWRSALRAAGAPVPKPTSGGWTPATGYLAGRRLAEDPQVTAILCGNDDVALAVIRALNEAGRPIPGNVSVVGFDDTPLARFYTPALTTVRQDFQALGRSCFAKLLSHLGDNSHGRQPPVPKAELIIRESTGPPPKTTAGPANGRARGRA